MTTSLLSLLSDNHPFSDDDYHWATNELETLLSELKMLFCSRSRIPGMDDIPDINCSVLNYGFNESFSNIIDVSSRRTLMVERIKNTLLRYEPRLTDVYISGNAAQQEGLSFTVNANFQQVPVAFELKWDDCTGKFYFYE